MEASKVFGIGLSKTGTTSLTRALRVLGYRATHFPLSALRCSSEVPQLAVDRIRKRDAFTDTPIPHFYRELDRFFPGSKFVLTVRNVESWLDSCAINHVWPGSFVHDKAIRNQRHVRALLYLHHALYGSVWFDRDTFRRSYMRHHEEVLE